MAYCPVCATEVNVDFGMATCPNPSCRLVFMVDIDGVASVSSDEPIDADLAEIESMHMSDGIEGQDSLEELMSTSDDVAENRDENGNASEYNSDFLSQMEEPAEAVPVETLVDTKDPLEVQAYDASRASQLIDGPYYYDLCVRGLDTGEIKDLVMLALNDKRFQWAPDEVRKSFQNGELIFKNLNPIKAVLMIIKLQHIDVEIDWSQKLHTDPELSTPQLMDKL